MTGGGGGRDSTSRVGPTPLGTVLAHLFGGGGRFPSHACSSIETQQAASLSGWRPPLPQIMKMLFVEKGHVSELNSSSCLFHKEKKQNTRTHIMTCQLRQYGGGAQRHRGCEASEIVFIVLVHVRTCLLAIFFSLCTGFEAVA